MRTSNIEAVQGDWALKRLVILEFDSLETAKGYISSADYAAIDDPPPAGDASQHCGRRGNRLSGVSLPGDRRSSQIDQRPQAVEDLQEIVQGVLDSQGGRLADSGDQRGDLSHGRVHEL